MDGYKLQPARHHSSPGSPSRLRSKSHPFLSLQRSVGNQAVSRFIQARLKIGQAGDVYEQEADHAADRVMRTGEPGLNLTPLGSKGLPSVQRECACQAAGSTGGPCADCEEERLQRFAASAAPVSEAPPLVHEVLNSPGRPLDGEVRTFMESRFGHDFGAVRVHSDARAAESAEAVNAHAYTVGGDIVFGPQQYNPSSGQGRRLIAHELAHTVQQAGAAPLRGTVQRQTGGASSVTTASTGTHYTPGEMHNHQPSGRWSDVQQDPRTSNPAIASVCRLFNPAMVMQIALLSEFGGKPIAREHLNWFLKDGGGSPYREDANLSLMLRTDDGVRCALISQLPPVTPAGGKFAGHFRIGQSVYQNQDFRFAFGAIDRMDFEVDYGAGTVHAWFEDRYEFHPVYPFYRRFPDDVVRVTNCVHAAAVELKSGSARDFWMKGEATVPLNLHGCAASAPAPASAPSPAAAPASPPGTTPSATPAPASEVVPAGQQAHPGYTACDFIDKRISVEAQRALYKLYRRGGTEGNDAIRMLGAVKSSQMKGVYKEDEQKPALMAVHHGSAWWKLIPKGRGATVSYLDAPPMMVFRRSLASDPGKLADAIEKAWVDSGVSGQALTMPPPSGKSCEPAPVQTVLPSMVIHGESPQPSEPVSPDLPLCIDTIDWDLYFTELANKYFVLVDMIANVCMGKQIITQAPTPTLTSLIKAVIGRTPTGCANYETEAQRTRWVEDQVVEEAWSHVKEKERQNMEHTPWTCEPWISLTGEKYEIRRRYRKWRASH